MKRLLNVSMCTCTNTHIYIQINNIKRYFADKGKIYIGKSICGEINTHDNSFRTVMLSAQEILT